MIIFKENKKYCEAEISLEKDLENDVLELDKKLLPLSSAYTQSGDSTSGDDTSKKDIGRPKKDQEDKEATTIQKEDSLDNQTGGN